MSITEKEYAVRPNKSQLKRDMRAVNELAQQLIDLPNSALAKIPLSATAREAIAEGKRLTRGALQRQLRRITTLLSREDTEAINLEVQRHLQPDRESNALFHKLEVWRDRLIDGDEQLVSAIFEEFPDIDRQHFRQLVRNAMHEREAAKESANKPPKFYRALFQCLRTMHGQ